MRLYCMCEAQNDKPDSQAFMAPNRYCAIDPTDPLDFPPVALRTPMRCIKLGAQQVIVENLKPNDWTNDSQVRPKDYRRHYPDVDVFECPNCHARIVREG